MLIKSAFEMLKGVKHLEEIYENNFTLSEENLHP
jgi:hypothetical protein